MIAKVLAREEWDFTNIAATEAEQVGCFWWEYARSSPEVRKLIDDYRKHATPTSLCAVIRSKAADFMGPTAITYLLEIGPSQKPLFPHASWATVRKIGSNVAGASWADVWCSLVDTTLSAPVLAVMPDRYLASAAELKDRCGTDGRVVGVTFKLPLLGGPSPQQPESRTSFLCTANWHYSNQQLVDAFKAQLTKLRPKHFPNPGRARRLSGMKAHISFKYDAALLWLSVLRRREKCGSWDEYRSLYRDAYAEGSTARPGSLGGVVPTNDTLIEQVRNARRILDAFKSGVIPTI